MTISIIASILSISSILLSAFLHGAKIHIAWIRNAHLLWLILPPLLFLTGSFALTLIAAAILIILTLFFQKTSFVVPFYIATLAVIPDYISAHLPFPGINYLLDINLPLLWSLLLCPFIINSLPRFIKKIDLTDVFILCFVLYASILSLRSTTFTDGLRHSFELFLIVVIPYCLINSSIKIKDDLYNALDSILTFGIILSCIGLFSTIKQWNFFEVYNPNALADIRYGFLRINASIVNELFGFICFISLGVLFVGVVKKNVSKGKRIFCGIFLILSLIMTFTRGAWLSSIIFGLIYALTSRKVHNITVFLVVLSLFFISGLYFFSPSGTSLDSFGTFEYRQLLYKAAFEQFKTAPILGDANYIDSPYISVLPHGGGIIDIVSGYLQIILEFGILGLILYLIPFVLLIYKLIQYRHQYVQNDEIRRIIAFLIATLISYLILIATVSFVSLVNNFGYILIAITHSFIFHFNKETFSSKAY